MTEQEFLGNVPRQAYLPNGHRIRTDFNAFLHGFQEAISEEVAEAAATDLPRQEADLWLDAEVQATKALQEIQDGNINASVAYLQSALAFALNYRHGLRFEVTEV